MATVLRKIKGLEPGERVKIHQFCNDWFMVDASRGRQAIILSPTALKLSRSEIKMVREAADAGRGGFLLERFVLESDGTFQSQRRFQ